MRAMILAAGRGERMRPLTDRVPKPLLIAGGKPLIVWHIEALARAGLREIVINHAHLGAMIEMVLGDGGSFGVRIAYSPEAEALETAGGIANALALLGEGPFVTVNADIFCDFDYGRLVPRLQAMALDRAGDLAHLVLVDNPPHNAAGDFALEGGRVASDGARKLTFSGIAIYRPELFRAVTPGTKARLAPLLRMAAAQGRVGGERHAGCWMDVGTPERLLEVDRLAAAR